MIHPWTQIDSLLYYSIICACSSLSLNLYFRGEPYLHFLADEVGYWVHQISTILIGLIAGKYLFNIWPNDVPVLLIVGLPIGLLSGLVWLAIFNPIYELLRR